MAINPTKTDEYQIRLEKLETDLKELRAKYDAYFNGVERIPPQKEHENFDREFRRLQTMRSNRTALRFRFQNLQASYITVQQYWTRTMRQIEDGTRKRDLFRVKQRFGTTSSSPAAGGGASKGEAPKDSDDNTPAVPLTADATYSFADEPAAPKPAAAKPAADPNRSVYEKYLQARQKTGEQAGVSYEKLNSSLQKQREAIKKKYNARDVEFKVVVEDGKAKIKAVPKR